MSVGASSDDNALLEKHRRAVRSSWRLVEESLIGPDFAQPFYDRLFE